MPVITKSTTLLLKGIGILLIISHNYFHWIPLLTGENEFSFNSMYINSFINESIEKPLNFIQYIVSYFGHYGVQLFVFISGYGLTIFYRNNNQNWVKFIKERVLKIYPTFTISIILLVIYNVGIGEKEFSLFFLKDILLRYFLIANWIPGKIFLLTGPFWFYSMIFQLYFCLPLLIKFNARYKNGLYLIIFLIYIFIVFFNEYFINIGLNLNYNFIGNLPVFILGIISTEKNILFNNSFILKIFIVIAFLLGQFFQFFWFFSQAIFVIFAVPLIVKFSQLNKFVILKDSLVYLGSISMFLFAVHGFLRKPWVGIAIKFNSEYSNYIFFLIYFFITFIMAVITQRIVFLIMKIISR